MMTASTAVERTEMPELKLLARGKVRDIYEVDEKSLLFVATDRLSAFDVVSIQWTSPMAIRFVSKRAWRCP
jgi:hypothetical protein